MIDLLHRCASRPASPKHTTRAEGIRNSFASSTPDLIDSKITDQCASIEPAERRNVRCRDPLSRFRTPPNASEETPDRRLVLRGRYSVLSASIGEIDAARFAGIRAATNEQRVSAPVATVSAGGSHQETPYNWADSSFPAAIARGNPSISPTNTRANAPASTSRTSAMRIPISFVFCATEYAVTPELSDCVTQVAAQFVHAYPTFNTVRISAPPEFPTSSRLLTYFMNSALLSRGARLQGRELRERPNALKGSGNLRGVAFSR